MVTFSDGRPVGFASPAFAGFALIVRIADFVFEKNGEPVNLQARHEKLFVFGGLAIMVTLGDGRPVGFASPAFAGFAFVQIFCSGYILSHLLGFALYGIVI